MYVFASNALAKLLIPAWIAKACRKGIQIDHIMMQIPHKRTHLR